MLDVPVYNTQGEQIDTLKVDEGLFGGTVNADLLKQAVVTYHANRRQGTAANKSRGLVAGTTAKAFRQKGTGRARRGDLRTPLLRGGGVTFRKDPRSFRKRFPKKMRRRALESALLAKMLSGDLLVVDGLAMDEPKTQRLAEILRNLRINRSCLLALARRDRNIHLSSRNIPDLTVRIAEELNAFDVATRQKMLVTLEAMEALTSPEAAAPDAETDAVGVEPQESPRTEPAPAPQPAEALEAEAEEAPEPEAVAAEPEEAPQPESAPEAEAPGPEAGDEGAGPDDQAKPQEGGS
ncbi:MAG TPA: 50S ribosomal protein L4 [Phycisphaerae bacterium]|nr:50S ribosomal protein L4 [Phycisphaerae bacterium]